MQHKRAATAVAFLVALACLAAPGAGQVTSITVVEKAGVTTANYPMTVHDLQTGDVA
jgi:proline racemase